MSPGTWHILDLVLVFIVFLLPIIALIWIYNDAEERYNAGCLWVVVIVLFSWFGIIFYFLMRYFTRGGETSQSYESRFPTGGRDLGKLGRGVPGAHTYESREDNWPDAPEFRDYRAEELIDDGKYEEAETYLKDMAAMARKEGAEKRITTYRFYYGKLKELMAERKRREEGTR